MRCMPRQYYHVESSPMTATPSPPIDLQVAAVYDELRRLAGSQIRHERGDHTLTATGLVHEAYLRLARANPQWESRAHFFGIAANAMRQILIDYAHAHKTQKRGGEWEKLTLTSALPEIDGKASDAVDVLELHSALQRLEVLDRRQARVVALRYFGGLSIEETAETMELSIATVKREWATAKIFLKRALHER